MIQEFKYQPIQDSSSQGLKEELLGVGKKQSDLEALQPREDMMIMQRIRIQYQSFLDKRKQRLMNG